jgi:DNA-directed RNA polymerase specialized sigma24 family protein
MTASNLTLLTEASNSISRDYRPKSFEDMFLHYYAFVHKFVKKMGIAPKDAEDITMAILVKFYERESFDYYDDEYVREDNPTQKVAAFRTFLTGFVKLYLRHYRERQTARDYREAVSLDSTLTGTDTLMYDHPSNAVEDSHIELFSAELESRIRKHLAATPNRGKLNLSEFFEQVCDHVDRYDKVNRAELASHFGVGVSTINNWLSTLRTHVDIVISGE